MLKRYEVSNFLSFKESTIFDLEKTNYQMLSSTNTVEKLLKGLLFVGANASGKSNSLQAIKILLDGLFGNNEFDLKSYLCLFSGTPNMHLKYEFYIDHQSLVYDISYLSLDDFITEDLYLDGKLLLSRKGASAEVTITEKNTYTDVPKNSLFLREIYFNTKFRGNSVLQHWFEFLSNSIYVDLYTKQAKSYKNIDFSLKKYIDENGPNQINAFFKKHNFEQSIEYEQRAMGHFVSIESSEKMILFRRKDIDEPIPYMCESLGNKLLLELLPAFFYCVENNGLLLLDEFSSGFHNDLEELLVSYFMRNSKRSQLIFVSHSTNLLTNRLLRPDQIYSVDFDANGSRIKKFSTEKPREAQNIEKMYLAGVFRGIPKYEDHPE